MIKQLLSFLMIFSILINTASSQNLMHSVGTTISLMSSRLTIGGTTGTVLITHTDLTYFPRLNLTESEGSSVSIGIPLSAGISLVSDVSSSESGVYWGFDLPLVFDYNFGAKSTRDNDAKFGGYFGAGFGYTFTNWTYDGVSNNKANSYGPLARAGARFGFPASETGQGMTVGVFYKLGLETEKFKTFGFNVLLDL